MGNEWVESVCRCRDLERATDCCDTCKAYDQGILDERERIVEAMGFQIVAYKVVKLKATTTKDKEG